MNLLAPLIRRSKIESRYTTDDYAALVAQTMGFTSFGYQGSQYPLGVNMTVPGSHTEPIANNFPGYVNGGLKSNGPVWTLEQIRVQVFSQARFQWRRYVKGRPGEMFGTAALLPVERPGLLARMILDVDLAGNFYGARSGDELVRLRPDWVDIILAPRSSPVGTLGDEVAGFIYWEGGQRDRKNPAVLMPGEVAHFAPMPDPTACYRGMSWLTPVIRELLGDDAYSRHKTAFVDNAATPNLAVALSETLTPEQFHEFVQAMDDAQKGPGNAGKTLYTAGGADVTVVGSNMQQLDFKVVQGAGETRIAAASGVGAIIAQFSEGMQGSSLNAGNYGAARRRFADITMRHLWKEAAEALGTVLDAPRDAHLWYDASQVSFLQEDEADAADIRNKDAQTLRTLLDAGYDPDAAVTFVQTGGDLSKLLGEHSGLFSVQLQEPGTTGPDEPPAPDEEAPPDA